MYINQEQKRIGQRNFWRIAGQGIDPGRFKLETCVSRQFPGGPVWGGIVGVGDQGSVLLNACQKEFIDIVAVCDINPAHRARATQHLVTSGWKKPREYEEWQEMAQKENLEVVILATPLWSHAEIAVGFLEAGTNVLCEKMMAYDEAGCRRMIATAKKRGRLLEIGYPRFYDVLHQAVYQNIISPKLLGDIHFVRLFTHRNVPWRRNEKPPFPGFDPKRWGYPDWESLLNWRMYNRYSRGLVGELGSHLTSFVDWYLGSSPRSVYGSGGIYYYKDGREVDDHIFMTFDYPGGCTVELSLTLTNSFDELYEEFLGSNGSLILREADGGMFFPKEEGCIPREPVADKGQNLEWYQNWDIAFRTEIWSLCSAVRQGTPLHCGPQRGLSSTIGCLAGPKAVDTQARVEIAES